MSEPSTPLMRQYAAIKKEHPNALLFFRLGDFYELFFDDAVLAARELQITLTSRNKEKGVAIPMCGVPYHAAEGYISKLIRRGFKVAVCEQVEDARLATKLVRREVTRVVTPGTAADSSLNAEENNFLAAVATVGDHVGFAALDLSTGEFRATEFVGESAGRRIQEELEQLRPKEVLYGSSAPLLERARVGTGVSPVQRNTTASVALVSGGGWAETPLDDWIFAPDHAIPLLENHFGVLSLEGFGLAGKPAAAAAAGAILYYIRSTQRGTLDHVDRIGFESLRRAFTRGLRLGRQTGGGFGGRGDPVLHPINPARHARPCGSNRLLRTAELPGARCGDGAQSGVDRTAIRGNGCGRNSVPLHGCDRDADGQAVAPYMDAAPVFGSVRDQWPAGFR